MFGSQLLGMIAAVLLTQAPAAGDPPPAPGDTARPAASRPASEPGGFPTSSILDIKPIVITLPRGEKGPIEQSLKLELQQDMKELLRKYLDERARADGSSSGDGGAAKSVKKGLDWKPRRSGRAFEGILRSASGKGDGRTIVVSEPVGKPVPIEVDFAPDPITRDEPGILQLRVRDPQEVRRSVGAGIFTGELVLEFAHTAFHEGKLPVVQPVSIIVCIPGQRIVAADFINRRAGTAPLQLGRPPSVEVDVESVGPLGSGNLELKWGNATATDTQTILNVPLPLPGPALDPRREKQDGWACKVDQWMDQPIVANDAAVETLRPAGEKCPSLDRHRLRVLLPDLVSPGRVQGSVAWRRDSGAVKESGTELALASTTVAPGLVAFPKWALPGERITVIAAVATPASGGDAAAQSVAFEHAIPGSPAERTTFQQRHEENGILSLIGTFQAGAPGEYRVTLAPDAPDWLRAALPDSASVRVPFWVDSALVPDQPLVLFTGPPPPYWVSRLGYSAENGAEHRLRRSNFLQLIPGKTAADLEDAKIRLLGTYLEDQDGPSDPLDPARDPRSVRIAVSGQPPPDPEAPPEWPTGPDGLGFDLVTELNPANGAAIDSIRGVTPLQARWLISGRGPDGQPVAFVYQQPFDLWVTSNWEYTFNSPDGRFIVLVAGLLAVLVLAGIAFVLWRLARARRSGQRSVPSRRKVSVPISSGNGVQGAHELDGEVGSAEAARPTKPGVAPKATKSANRQAGSKHRRPPPGTFGKPSPKNPID